MLEGKLENEEGQMPSDGVPEKLKGIAKETAGRLTEDEDLERAGRAQQQKAQNAEEAERLEREAAEKRAKAADHEREQEDLQE
jgi:uncharacterized protein YjbJ (UPF0337 family)